MVECPSCSRCFETKQGVRIHHTKSHGEPLPNRTCKGCETSFYDPKSRRSFCEDCDPNAGSNNGNWKDAKVETSCGRCGERFEYYPSEKPGKFCSDCVEEADEFLGDPFRVDGERVHKDCEQCGKSMKLLKSRLERGYGRFCSRDCLARWLSPNVVGESHHQYENETVAYRGEWWQIRRQARKRDNHECQVCGREKEEMGREPDVHHIKPIREFEDPQEAHVLSNVISLCRSCHRKVEADSIEIDDPEQ